MWGDDFNGAQGSAPDPTKWTYDLGNNFGNGEVDTGTNSRANSYLDGNGNLIIAALYNAATNTYTSAHLKTAGLYAAGPYGRIEARIQTPYAQGVGEAFWALGNDYFSQNTPWPWSGELDMMEISSATPGHNGSTIHGGQTDGGNWYEYNGLSKTVDLPPGQQFNQAFHVFGVNWAPYHITYDLDGVQYGEVYLHNIGATDVWAFNQSIYLILSVGVGAGNTGAGNGTGFPTNLTADYVHVSRWSNGTPAAPANLTATGTTTNATTLSWTASSSTDNPTYNIYASTAASYAPSLSTLVAENVSGTSFTQTGLAANTTYYYQVVASDFGGESSPAKATVTTQPPGNSSGVKLSAGGYAVGNFMTSEYVLGGSTNYHPGLAVDTSLVSNPAPQQVYQVERFGAAAWTITDLNPGAIYQVRLHMVETAHTGVGQRLFNVSINSQTVLPNFDIFQTVGAANRAAVETFYTKANDYGIIELQTLLGTSTNSGVDLNPTISAIEINPSSSSSLVGAAPGSTTNLSINAGGPAVSNFAGDEFYNGGDVATATNAINTSAPNAAPQAVYQSQRYVPFTYVLTGLVAEATYTVRMHFAETFWTAGGKRIFNVSLNGAPVLANLDVFAQAGANTALVKQFMTRADQYGQIIVQLIYGGADQPFICGLEAIESAAPVGPPTNLTATSNSTGIALNWTASSTGGVTYTIFRNPSGSAPVAIASGQTGTTFSDTVGLISGTTYFYSVAAVSAGVQSANSNTASATFQANTTVGAPSNLSATANATAIALAWTASSTAGVHYTVYRNTSGTSPAVIASGLTGTTYSDSNGLTNGITYYYSVAALSGSNQSPNSNTASATFGSGSQSALVSINAGGQATGNFSADEDFSGGGTAVTANAIVISGVANAAPAAVYQSERAGQFTYTAPGLAAGSSYTVRLHFAEFYWTKAGQRVFNVSVNGTLILTNFDIIAATGAADKALVESFAVTANSSGQIVIGFTNGSADQPKVSGIEILGASAPPPPSLSINAGGPAAGNFVPDEDVIGGGTAVTANTISTAGVANAAPMAVYQSERAGVFTYTIPGLVAGSSHTVRLHFAEFYWSKAGQRVFNVNINGAAVLANFDIVAVAGGSNKALVEQFTATANTSGQIVVQFNNGTADQAKVSGIEVQ